MGGSLVCLGHGPFSLRVRHRPRPTGQADAKDVGKDHRRHVFGKSCISVKLSTLNLDLYGNKAIAKFRPSYYADSLNLSSRKTLDLVKSGDRWVIVKESSGAG